MSIVFVYAGDPNDPRESSPYTITRNLYRYFKARADVRYHDWAGCGPIEINDEDIFIGHPNYPENSITQWVFRNADCRAKFLIHPLHHGDPQYNLPFDWMAKQADAVFSIMGPYWYDTLESSVFAHWKSKMIRLDMAVDSEAYPHVKRTFAPPGQRDFTYIGSNMPMKNTPYLAKIMRKLPERTMYWYGGDGEAELARLPNVKTVGWVDIRQHMSEICEKADIFLNVSYSDANPTTLLEATSSGLIAACTKESGYYDDPMFTELYLNDLNATLKAIDELQHAPTEELMERSLRSRRRIETQYNWEQFCSKVWNRISQTA